METTLLQMPSRPARWVAPAVAAGLAVLFAAGTLLAPLLDALGVPGGEALRGAYRSICHQVPERSLRFAGEPLAACARCTGLYIGGALGLLFASLPAFGRRGAPRPIWLAAAAAPTLVDAAFALLGLPATPNAPRLALALPAGLVAGLFLAEGISDLVRWIRRD